MNTGKLSRDNQFLTKKQKIMFFYRVRVEYERDGRENFPKIFIIEVEKDLPLFGIVWGTNGVSKKVMYE